MHPHLHWLTSVLNRRSIEILEHSKRPRVNRLLSVVTAAEQQAESLQQDWGIDIFVGNGHCVARGTTDAAYRYPVVTTTINTYKRT